MNARTRPIEAASNDAINAIRFLACDAVQAANSGHPGAPMGMAEMAYALWTRHLKHNPANPAWPDRDRFGEREARPLVRRTCVLDHCGGHHRRPDHVSGPQQNPAGNRAVCAAFNNSRRDVESFPRR